MSDTTGDRPDDTTPTQPPVPPVWHAPGAPAQQGAPGYGGYAGAPGQPPRPPYPSHPQQAYAPPRQPVYPGQPGQPTPQAYAGAAPYGAAFGPGAQSPQDSQHQTQPTQPLGPPTGAVAQPAAPTQRSGAGKIAGLIVAAALVGGAAGLGGAYAGVNLFTPVASAPASGPSTVTVNDTDSVNQTAGIAAKVVPSVVTIEVSGQNGGGTGSGVILTSDGYVLTNTHVVTLDGATGSAAVRVSTSDGRVYDAEVVGTDPLYDLAVIKLVDAEGLTPIEFADSGMLNVGDPAVAVGAPLGLSNTVTTGIVSALNRSIEIASSAAPEEGDDSPQEETPGQEGPFFFDFGQEQSTQQATETIKIAVIQTDAAINPGNSGGALVDDEGRLIGINVAIASAGSSSGQAGSIGVGFAIPSNIAQRIADEIMADGAATHGLLGAIVQGAAAVEGSTITGAWVKELTPGGAAEAAGLQMGDTITAFDGIPITDGTDLTAQVRAHAAGSTVTVTYVRDGRTLEAEVTLGELAQ